MKRMLLIVNPTSGQRRGKRYLSDIISIFSQAGFLVEVYITACQGDASRQVQLRAAEKDIIVCAGGDGTLNETVTGLLHSGCDVPLGYIPCGSTNDFAASLKLPGNILQAARRITEGTPTRYDVGQFDRRYFTYVASFGAFTRAAYATPQNIKNALGHTAYVLEGIQELSQIRKEHIRMEVDGHIIEDDFIFGAISNSTSVGGILTLDPTQVDMGDGKFEIMLLRSPRSLTELSECIQAVKNQKYNCAMVTFFSAKQVKIFSDPSMSWTLDGEKESGHSEIEITNLHHAISLIR